MSVLSNGICGFEIAQVPPSGVTSGFLDSTNGYVAADLTSGSARTGSLGYNSRVTVATQSHHARVFVMSAATALPGSTTAWEARARCHFKAEVFPSSNDLVIFGMSETSLRCRIEMSTTGQLRMVSAFCGNATSSYSSAITLGVWYRIDMRIYGTGSTGTADATHDSSSEAIVYLDSTGAAFTSFSASLDNGNNMPTNWCNLVTAGQTTTVGPSCTREIHYDDLWWKFATDTDVAALEWPTATKVFRFVPNANGSSTQFARGGVDSGANWSQVDETPPNTGGSQDTLTSATAGNTNTFTKASATGSGDVYHIRNISWMADSTSPQTLLIDAVEYDSATATGGSTLYAVGDKAYTNASPLSATLFDTLQFGVKKKSGVSTLTVDNLFLEVLASESDIVVTGGSGDFGKNIGFDGGTGITLGGTNSSFTPIGGSDDDDDDDDGDGDTESDPPLIFAGLYPTLKIILQTNESQETASGIRKGWSTANGKISRAYSACLYSENIDDNNARSLVLKPLIGVTSTDGYVLLCDIGDDDNGTNYYASLVTKSLIPRGLPSKFGITDTFLLATPDDDASVKINLIRDFGKETISRTTDLEPEGNETQVIKRLDSSEIAECIAVKIEIEDLTTPSGNWELNRLDLVLRSEQDRG